MGAKPNLKPATQAEAPRQVNRPLSQKDWEYVSVCCLCSALGSSVPRTVSPVYKSVGPKNTSLPGLQSQVIKGYLLGSSHKNGAPDPWVPEASKSSLECGRGRAWRWYPLAEISQGSIDAPTSWNEAKREQINGTWRKNKRRKRKMVPLGQQASRRVLN